jgi:HEAT repeat protein
MERSLPSRAAPPNGSWSVAMISWKAASSGGLSILAIAAFVPVVEGHSGIECRYSPGIITPPITSPPDPAAPSAPPPSGPSAPPSTGSPKPGTSKGGGGAPRPGTPPSRPATGGSTASRGGATTLGSLDRWEFWWESNEDAWLLPASARDTVVSAAGSDGLTTAAAPVERGPSAGVLRTKALPQLLALLSARETDLVDSSAMALGHIVQADEANLALKPLTRLLDHAQLSVRESATIALGMVGSSDALPMLRDLLLDSPHGRELTSHPAGVEPRVRAFAAASMGMIGERTSFADLKAVLDDPLLARQIDLQQLALVALGLLRDAESEVVPYVVQLLGRRDVDRFVRAQAPTTLARVASRPQGAAAARAALAQLVSLLQDGETERELRRSTAVAIGRIATAEDAEAIDALIGLVAHVDDGVVRHFALIALGEIAGTDADPVAHAAAQKQLEGALVRELESPRRSEHRSFAALALGIAARNAAQPAAVRARIGGKLLEQFTACGNPSHRGALALGLGLARERAAAATIAALFAESKDSMQRGYFALALGLLGAREQAPALLLAFDRPRLDPGFELKLARALTLLDARGASTKLAARLHVADTAAEVAPTALALARTGESGAFDPLLEVTADESLAANRRGMAAESLGILASASELPWNLAFKADTNYLIRSATLAHLAMAF